MSSSSYLRQRQRSLQHVGTTQHCRQHVGDQWMLLRIGQGLDPTVKEKHKYGIIESLRPWKTRTHCCQHIVADTNVSPFARVRNICCGHKFCVRDTKMFLILFRNILCPQQMFPSLRSPRNIMGNNVSATMCPHLPGPLGFKSYSLVTSQTDLR